ncbi:outer membrane protein assembly factor BamA [Sphingomonas sp.]|uniref:outer membrane protein assembly factor BamA n=1 Tax=Sphingomonas sp. TaxID=28214 RepID=UPI003750E01A
MNASTSINIRRFGALLLVGTVLGASATPLLAQAAPAAAPAPVAAATAPAAAPTVNTVAAPSTGTIRSIKVVGAERLEPETIRSYANLVPGQTYTTETLDTALKDLYATELFSDVVISGTDTGDLIMTVRENPVINRIVLEGNKRLKSDKITPEIKLAPRQIFTRSKVRADVDRIIELYKRQGRFAATVEPKTVQLDQNRVDLVFEISEGDKSKVRAINIIGADHFPVGKLRKQMYTKQAGGLLGFMKSNDSYDPDRLAADQQKLRAYYLTQGYADFRVVSALAELTPDRKDFVITYVVEEGPRYKFGKITAESDLRDFNAAKFNSLIKLKEGSWFNAKAVEDTVTVLNEIAGTLGYAFADISPNYDRDSEKHIMGITFHANETPRVYVEHINIQGNTSTRDKVLRREFRVNEGDAFNSLKVKRSQDRIQSLGFFQEKLEVKQTQGSSPDRVDLGLDVEEKSTGQLQLSAGYSSLEKFIISASIEQNNFRGMAQTLSAGINYSRYSKSIQLGFTEPYFLDKQILLGGDIFRRDYNSFNYIGNTRNTTYTQLSTGSVLRLGFPITEFASFGTRYSLIQDQVSLDKRTFYTLKNGVLTCDPLRAGRYLCDEIGKRITSSVGYSLGFDNTDGIRPTRGQRLAFSQDFAGLGGDVKYLRTSVNATKYFGLPRGFVFSIHGEGGYIAPLGGKKFDSEGNELDGVRLTDRFFGAQLRGFDIRGIGPRITRQQYSLAGALLPVTKNSNFSDSLGGRAYYMGRLELEIPLGAGARSLGLRPSAFVDAGSVWSLTRPRLTNIVGICTPKSTAPAGTPTQLLNTVGQLCPGETTTTASPIYSRSPGYRESFLGDSPSPRLAIGIGVNWTSPFGPLRIDLAKALLKQKGDETKLFSFNVGTQF